MDRHVKISSLPFRDYGLDDFKTRKRLFVKHKIPAFDGSASVGYFVSYRLRLCAHMPA
jgi:hypothetical protein